MAGNPNQQGNGLAGVNPDRLFLGSCLALIATAVWFAVSGDILGALKTKFVLTNAQVGSIAGVAMYAFTGAIFVFGPLCDVLGMRNLLYVAFLGHTVGVLLMIFANGYNMLWCGALILGIGNGTVEAVCNPMIATIYPKDKTTKLNHFHVWFPGGIVIGGVACWILGKAEIASWQVRLCLILVPTLIYGIIFLGQKFPLTERVQSGLSFADMVKATVGRPLFILLFCCMMVTASLELGPGRWIPSILAAGGMAGILVLAWINGIMAILRASAGAIVHRLSPTGVLVVSAILAGVGLYGLSYAENLWAALAAATVFALGVCYFWPTMLGVTSERVPKGGALALALMGGIGNLAVGWTTPQMGAIADRHLPDQLDFAKTKTVLEKVVSTFPDMQAKNPKIASDYQPSIDSAKQVLDVVAKTGNWPHPDTANALRAVIGSNADSPVVKEAGEVLNPADNYGGRMSFRIVALFSAIIIVVFGAIYLTDKAKGGYKQEHIGS
jgi:MFS family permease